MMSKTSTPARTRSTVLAATLLAATATCAIAAISGAGSAGAATRVPACTGAQLTLHVNRNGLGAAGHDGLVVEYRNTSHRTCSITGYPGVDALVGHHRIASARRTRGPLTVRTVTLEPGHWASALVDWTTMGPDGMVCAGGTDLAVTAPNTTRTVILKKTATGCDLQVHPTVAGRKAGLTG